jgi:hypothetical protein
MGMSSSASIRFSPISTCRRCESHDVLSDAVGAALIYLKLQRLITLQRAAAPGPLAALARLLTIWKAETPRA